MDNSLNFNEFFDNFELRVIANSAEELTVEVENTHVEINDDELRRLVDEIFTTVTRRRFIHDVLPANGPDELRRYIEELTKRYEQKQFKGQWTMPHHL